MTKTHVTGLIALALFSSQAAEVAAQDCQCADGAVFGRGAIGNVECLCAPNLAAAAILSKLDLDGDENDLPDNSPDTDGDGLPDTWEDNVFIPAPTAIVPGTPPTPIFSRLGVKTDKFKADTDGDGLTDFVEVFGLMFIDENRDGILNFNPNPPDLETNEWLDTNADGLPSPGEQPLDNAGDGNAFGFFHDFDGFVFTDPTNADTDGDSLNDGEDVDPLINPRSFGNDAVFISRIFDDDKDLDNDGLGNGMDMGNDLVGEDGVGRDFQLVDNPQNIAELLDLFRDDLLADQVIPEAAIEDLLGVDWDGNGLWRTTDVRDWHIVIDNPIISPDECALAVGTVDPACLFTLDDPQATRLYVPQSFADVSNTFNGPAYDRYGERGIGLGWQELLAPPSGTGMFIPDPRVWTILYSWRMPGFDIDGDGFVGAPTISASAPSTTSSTDNAEAALRRQADMSFEVTDDVPLCAPKDDDGVEGDDPDCQQRTDRPFDDRIAFASSGSSNGNANARDPSKLDGQIVPPPGFPALPCGSSGGTAAAAIMLLMLGLRWTSRAA